MKLALLAALSLAPADTARAPFGPGERLDYSLSVGPLTLGSAFMEVVGPDSVAGHPTWHLRMAVRLRALAFASNDTLESWLDRDRLVSRRFHRLQHQTNRERRVLYEIDPERRSYTRHDRQKVYEASADPLDDVSFLYVVRTLPLEVGHTYRYDRYFDARLAALELTVLRRESLQLPDGSTTPCLVLAPVIGERGLFAPEARARLWLTDDARRLPVQITARLEYGDGMLRLASMRLASGAP